MKHLLFLLMLISPSTAYSHGLFTNFHFHFLDITYGLFALGFITIFFIRKAKNLALSKSK